MILLMLVGQWRIGFATLWLSNALVILFLALGLVHPVARIRKLRRSAAGGRMPFAARVRIAGIATTRAFLAAFFLCGLAIADSALWPRGTGDYEHARIEMAGNGTEVMVSGPVEPGFAGRLRDVLDAHPRVTTLQLQGPGGLAIEAQKTIALVRERGLSTFVRSRCVSACAEIFLAGDRRIVLSEAGKEDAGGPIGFHRAGLAIGSLPFDFWGLLEDRWPWLGSTALRGRVATVPFAAMWTPSERELISYGVVTEVERVDTRPYDVYGSSWATPGTLEDSLTGGDGVPSWRALRTLDPAASQRAHLLLWLGVRRGMPLRSALVAYRLAANQAVLSRLVEADAETLREAAGLLAESMAASVSGGGDGRRWCRPMGLRFDLMLAFGRRKADGRMERLFATLGRTPPARSGAGARIDPRDPGTWPAREERGGDCGELADSIQDEIDAGEAGVPALRERVARALAIAD